MPRFEMKYFYKSISALFVFFMVSGVIAGERNAWKVEPISHSTGYTVPGSMMSQHQFGMLKPVSYTHLTLPTKRIV